MPAADLESTELEVNDAHAVQAAHAVIEHLAHVADLPVQPLGLAEVKKELKGRYPQHPWPDDPWNAAPTD